MKDLAKQAAKLLASATASVQQKEQETFSVDSGAGTPTLYRAETTPKGNSLATYTASILAVMGAMGSPRKIEDIVSGKPIEFPPLSCRQFVAFYDTASALNYHAKKGNFEKAGNTFRLTRQGYEFFIARKFGKGHINILDDAFKDTIAAIKSGKPEKHALPICGKMRACKS
jgi:hypothetical protein